MKPNPNVKNPCPDCSGWGFRMVSRDPDIDQECPWCRGHGEQRNENDDD